MGIASLVLCTTSDLKGQICFKKKDMACPRQFGATSKRRMDTDVIKLIESKHEVSEGDYINTVVGGYSDFLGFFNTVTMKQNFLSFQTSTYLMPACHS